VISRLSWAKLLRPYLKKQNKNKSAGDTAYAVEQLPNMPWVKPPVLFKKKERKSSFAFTSVQCSLK
jgi:hypothetical protein